MSSIRDESFSHWSREAQHDGRTSGAPARTKGTGCADVPSGPLSTLVVKRPGVEFSYRITPADLLWTARMIQGEAGGRKDADNYAVIWAMLNRFALLTNRKRLKKGYRTFSDFIRSYSTPLQSVLSYGSAIHHYDKPGYVAVGGAYSQNPRVPRGQLARHLKLQKTCWTALSQGARAAALAVLTGQVGSPIGLATEFANTATYFRRKYKDKPTIDQWKAFNNRFGESKKYSEGKRTLDRDGWRWIGDRPGLSQYAVNTFFVRTRPLSGDPSRVAIADLPPDSVKLLSNGQPGATTVGVSERRERHAETSASSGPDHESEWTFEDRELEADLEYEQVPLTAPDAAIPGRTVALVPANACQVPKTRGKLVVRARRAITHIVIHTIERTNYASSINNWRIGGGKRCFKPHYAVSRRGEITQIVAEQHIAQHGHGANPYSIGIEHEGFSRNPDDLTEDLYAASAALCRDICRRHNIAVDAAHIIGHDMAPGNCAPGGSCHGDPGGYWDWEYFLALVRWDGISPQSRPIRLIVHTASAGFSVGKHWSWTNGRKTGSGGPHPKHSWSTKFVSVAPNARAPQGDVARFKAVIPAYGRYDVSLWWPAIPGNNTATPVRVDKLGYLTGTLGVTPIVQNTHRVRSRRTRALPATPVWKSLGELSCVAGNVIQVDVSRQSAQPGRIVADAVRIFRKS